MSASETIPNLIGNVRRCAVAALRKRCRGRPQRRRWQPRSCVPLRGPFAWWHAPFSADLAQPQEEQLRGGLIRHLRRDKFDADSYINDRRATVEFSKKVAGDDEARCQRRLCAGRREVMSGIAVATTINGD